MMASAQLPAEHLTVGMLPVAAEFDRLLRLRVRDPEGGEETEKVLRVSCFKPAAPATPTTEDLRCLAPLERALRVALAAQQLCLDAETLVAAFAPLLKEVRNMQGIRAHYVDLSQNVLNDLFGTKDISIDLLELPADLRELRAEVLELTVESAALREVPEWLGEFVHLELLRLDGTLCDVGDEYMNDVLEELPASLSDLRALRSLTIQNFSALHILPESIGRLTSLEILHIEGCHPLQELPGMSAMKHLTSFTLDNSVLKELPCLGHMNRLQYLYLWSLSDLAKLPSSIGNLTGLRDLRIVSCRMIMELPTIEGLMSLETLHIESCDTLRELPASIDALMVLQTLHLNLLPNLKALPVSIGALIALTNLNVYFCGLTDLPSSIESLTALRTLMLSQEMHPDGRALKTLACALPALRLLQRLVLFGVCEDDVLALGCSLKAWPLPLLDLDNSNWRNASDNQICLTSCWEALGLPPEAATWENTAILQHWRVQQEKVAALASGLHAQLGAASRVSSLNDVALVLIADEVLGGWSLLKLWQRERLAREQAHGVQTCNIEGGKTGPAEHFGSFEFSAGAPGTFSAFVWNFACVV